MKVFLAVLVPVLVNLAASLQGDTHAAGAVTPVQKVVQMLSGMELKAKAAKHEEEVQYAAFKQFCDGTTSQKQTAIENANTEIEALKADIQAYDAEVTRLAGEIVTHNTDIASNSEDTEAATTVRDTEHVDYLQKLQDYTESINALRKAIQVLKAQNYDRPGVKASLLEQVKAGKLPQDAQRSIEAFLAEEPELGAAPVADAYQFRSTDILDLLEKLEDKFISEKQSLESSEVTSRSTYDLRMQNLHSSTEEAKRAIADKSEFEAKNKASSVAATANLKDVTSVRDADQKYLTDLSSTCQQKATEFAARQQLRTEEITALSKAIQIMSGEAVAGAATKHLPAGALLQHATMLAQLRVSSSQDPNQMRAAAYLNDESTRIGSHMLSALAFRARADPFQKVKKMIEDLIKKLIQEEGSEATHKGWCDTELGKNKNTRIEKAAKVDTLTSEIEELTASVSKLQKSIDAKSAEKSELEAAVAEKTDLRNKEAAENNVTIADAVQAQQDITKAVETLKTFFDKAAKAESMLQAHVDGTGVQAPVQPQPKAPPIFDTAYKGLQSESTGVFGLLEVIQADFARLEADTKSAEAAAKAEYDAFMSDSQVNEASLTTDINHMKTEKVNEEGELSDKKTSLEDEEKMLKEAKDYYETLKPTCINSGQTYEERKLRREDEIQALKEALRILGGEDLTSALQMQ